MNKSLLTTPTINWSKVSERVSAKSGKIYTQSYCRDVWYGRLNSKVLLDLIEKALDEKSPIRKIAEKSDKTTINQKGGKASSVE